MYQNIQAYNFAIPLGGILLKQYNIFATSVYEANKLMNK